MDLRAALNDEGRLRVAMEVARRHEAGERSPYLNQPTVKSVSEIPLRKENPLAVMDRLLLRIANGIDSAVEYFSIDLERDNFRFGFRSREELGGIIDLMGVREWIEFERQGGTKTGYRPTLTGWERVQELQKTPVAGNLGFVAMSFHPSLKTAFTLGIKPALENTGYNPQRVDSEEHDEKIDDRIIAMLRQAVLVVADFTFQRNGVYFEVGFARGLGIPVISTCRADDERNLHFDTRQYPHILWNNEEDLRSQLETKILALYPRR